MGFGFCHLYVINWFSNEELSFSLFDCVCLCVCLQVCACSGHKTTCRICKKGAKSGRTSQNCHEELAGDGSGEKQTDFGFILRGILKIHSAWGIADLGPFWPVSW